MNPRCVTLHRCVDIGRKWRFYLERVSLLARKLHHVPHHESVALPYSVVWSLRLWTRLQTDSCNKAAIRGCYVSKGCHDALAADLSPVYSR